MTTVFEEVVYFKEGVQQSDTPRLGHNSASSADDYVMRLKFTTPDIGAASFQFEINNAYWYPLQSDSSALNMTNHNNNAYFLYAISTSETEYADYNHSAAAEAKAYDGVVLVKNDNSVDLSESGWYSLYCDTIEKMLLPNTTYYLWIFPNFQSKYYYWYFSGSYPVYNYTVDGAAGLVRIDTGDGWVTAIPYVDDGTAWRQAIPYIDNGSNWKICG